MRTPFLLRPLALAALLALADLPPATPARAADFNRLDRDVVPTFQSIRLQLDPSRPDYSGAVHIDLSVQASIDSFRLYAKGMDVIRVALSGGEGPVAVSHAAGQGGLLIVRGERPLAAGRYGLDIDFQNNFDTRAGGLYRVKSGEDWYCFTQFEPTAAREAFPCWDEPEFKIPFQLVVTVPAKHAVVSNTAVEKQSTVGDRRTVTFKRTPPLPSYLVAIAAGPLEFTPIRGLSVAGRVVSVRGKSRLAGEAARITPPLLAALEEYFGHPYPYEKLDLIAVPEFAAGAMENPGAVTYREEILLVDPATAGVRERYRLITITAHELAHMWFGNLVTMAWWDDLWLNESFASWMGDKIAHQVFPQFDLPVRTVSSTQGAMESDARSSTRAIRQAVDAFANIDRLFDELAYQKGQAVLEMLEDWLGAETFRRGTMAYLKEHEWKNATAADLWRALSAASGRDVAAVTTSFLDQGGVPLVIVDLLGDGAVRLRQQRLLHFGVTAAHPASWKIPLRLRYSDGRQVHTQDVLLEEGEQIVRLEKASSPLWVHPNAGERGYYRWSVPAAMLQGMAGSRPPVLEARERVGFLGNLAALLDAGLIPGDEYLRLLGHFVDDDRPEVVSALIAGLEKVREVFVTAALEQSFATVVRKMLGPSLNRFGRLPARYEPEPVTLMRPVLLATLGVHGREQEVLDWAGPAARRYLAHPESVHASLAGTALNVAARQGDMTLFEDYRTRLEGTKIPSERARFLTALGQFRNPRVMERALDYALAGPLRPQEILSIPRSLMENEELRERVWRWFRASYPQVVQRIPRPHLTRLPSFARCCQTLRIAEAEGLFRSAFAGYPGTGEELAKVVDSIRDCVRLREREGAAVARYLVQLAAAGAAPGP